MPCLPDGLPPRPRGDHLGGYIDPASEAEAEERIRSLTYSISKIETDLGDRLRLVRMRWTDEEYANWRLGATVAYKSKLEERRRCVLWLKRWRRTRQAEGQKGRRLVVGLYELLQQLDAEWSAEETALIGEAGKYLGVVK